MKKLDGQIIIITGGARGIGEGICKLFCDEGAIVFLWDVLEDGQKTADNILENGGSIIFQKVDVSNQDSVNSAVQNIIENHGKIDVLINNAGIKKDDLLIRMKDQDWLDVLNINLNSVYKLTKNITKQMFKQRSGKIVSISSVVGFTGNPGQTNYVSTKSALVGFTKSLAKEVGSSIKLMKGIKHAFDPKGLLNPGKLFV